MNILVNSERAEFVFDKLLARYYAKQFPYNLPGVHSPTIPENLPKTLKRGTREHALYLFCLCCFMRGGIESDTATIALSRLYDRHPALFLPENDLMVTDEIAEIVGSDHPLPENLLLFPDFMPGPIEVAVKISDEEDEEDLLSDLMSDHLRFFRLNYNAAEIGRAWRENFARLRKLWYGDPRNLLIDVDSYEDVVARVRNDGKGGGFLGFQEKMVSMLMFFLGEAGFFNAFAFPIPVDFHVARIVLSTEIAVVTNAPNGNLYKKELLDAIRALCLEYCVAHRVDPLDLCCAVWLYSRTLCRRHPGNQSIVGERNGRNTPIHPIPKWTAPQSAAYFRSCFSCDLKDVCRWCVPSAHYYVRGELILRSLRDEPPQDNLFSIFK